METPRNETTWMIQNNIKMHLKEIGLETVGWINLCQDRDKCQVVVNTVRNLRGVSISRRTKFRGIS
jgi:hypothetical protein